jgi:hypothetical protein
MASMYHKLQTVLGPNFRTDLRRSHGGRIDLDDDSADAAITVVCDEYPGGFLLIVDASTVKTLEHVIQQYRERKGDAP